MNNDNKNRDVAKTIKGYLSKPWRIFPIVSQYFIFMFAFAATVAFGFTSLTGLCLLEDATASIDRWPMDWTNVSEVRFFLWSFSAIVSLGIALATYVVNDQKISAVFGLTLMAFFLPASHWNLEVISAICLSILTGLFCGWVVNRVSQSQAATPLARITGRLIAIFLFTTTLFLVALPQNHAIVFLVVVPIYYLKVVFLCSGGVMKLYMKAESDLVAYSSAKSQLA